jgi:hypothetical protein
LQICSTNQFEDFASGVGEARAPSTVRLKHQPQRLGSRWDGQRQLVSIYGQLYLLDEMVVGSEKPRPGPGSSIGHKTNTRQPRRWLILFQTSRATPKPAKPRSPSNGRWYLLPLRTLPSAPLPTAKLWDTVCQRNVSGPSANSFLLSPAGLRRTSRIRQGRQSSSLAVTVALGRKQHGCASSYTFTSLLDSSAVYRCCFRGVPKSTSPRAQLRSHRRRSKSSKRRREKSQSFFSKSTYPTSSP